MSTTPVVCPRCGGRFRVAVQVASIEPGTDSVFVRFDSQKVAHICNETDLAIQAYMTEHGVTRAVAYGKVKEGVNRPI